MGFFKNLGQGLAKVTGKVTKVVGGVVGKAAHAIVSNVPIVKNVYGMVTNIVGKDLGDAGTALGNLADKGLSKIYKGTASDAANAEEIHDGLQMESGKTEGFEISDHDAKAVSYPATPEYEGMYLTANNTEASYDSNPILLPAAISSGASNQTLVNAVSAQGINPSAVQYALTGETPRGNTANLTPILDLVSGETSPEVVLASSPVLKKTSLLPWILGGSVFAGILYYYFYKK
jgi:hypothetical protein